MPIPPRSRAQRRVEGVTLKDGRTIEADAVVVAIGIRPSADLARDAGIAVKRGIVVDDALETNVAGIHAIGECAEHRGICYGLVEPAYEQARVLADRLAGRDAQYAGSVLATNLKVSGVNVFSAGDFLGQAGTEEIVLSDPGIGLYKKLVVADGRLVGSVLFGDTADGLWYLDLIRSGASIAHIRDDLAFGRAFAERGEPAPPTSWPRDMSGDFSPEQKRYLEGFVSGLNAARATRGALPARQGRAVRARRDPPQGAGPCHGGGRQARRAGEVQARAASVRCLRPAEGTGGEERAAEARRQFPLAVLRALLRGARAGRPTCAGCAFRTASSSTGSLPGVADLAERCGGPYAHVTTRANLQIREIEPKHAVEVVEGIESLGLWSRGSGADNIRNVTGTPTAGIDPQELIDTRPYAREWHFHILNDRALYGLPRKFNVGFDGGGIIPVLEDTNDIGFQAVEVIDGHRHRAGHLVPPRARRHHGPPRFRARHRRDREAEGRHEGRRRGGARVHRARRPHQPQQGAAQVCARCLGLREIPRRRRGEARLEADPRARRGREAAARRSIARRISACARRSRRG